ncbi:hypothetical protein ACUH93_07040 [Dermabacteraceae bacterium P7006]
MSNIENIKIQRVHAVIEFNDGRMIGPVRIILADKIQWSRTARVNNWDTQDETLILAFAAWHAAKRVGLIDMTYEEFVEQTADVYPDIKNEEYSENPQ